MRNILTYRGGWGSALRTPLEQQIFGDPVDEPRNKVFTVRISSTVSQLSEDKFTI